MDAADHVTGTGDFIESAGYPVAIEVDPVSGDLFYVAIFAGEIRRIRYVPAVVSAVAFDGACASAGDTCASVAILLHRTDTTPARSASVTFRLSPELQLCSSAVGSITQGHWLQGFASAFQATDNLDGSYTVVQSILAASCTSTADDTLCVVQLRGVTDGTGVVTISSAALTDCDGGDRPSVPGAAASIPVFVTAPSPITTLATARVTTGNDASGTAQIVVTWAPVGVGNTVSLYRKGFGAYPLYEVGGGVVPAAPATPWAALAAGWQLTGVTTSGATDQPPTRDSWYYVAFVETGCEFSAVSNRSAGTLNYHLGDVVKPGDGEAYGDNLVTQDDTSLLDAHYPSPNGSPAYLDILDVGPTADGTPAGRPRPDGSIEFEDLMLFAIDFGAVSKAGAPARDAAGVPAPHPPAPRRGVQQILSGTALSFYPGNSSFLDDDSLTVHVLMDGGAADVRGTSLVLEFDPAVIRPVAADAGASFAAGSGCGFFQAWTNSASVGDSAAVDIASLGCSVDGPGDLLQLCFVGVASGTSFLRCRRGRLRDSQNVSLAFTASTASIQYVRTGTDPGPVPLPGRVTLAVAPNPFNPKTRLTYTLPQPGRVDLAVYSAAGKRIRTLLRGWRAPGQYVADWDGTDAYGARVASGTFYARLVTPAGRQTRALTLAK